MLERFWSGVVGAVAGAAVGLVLSILMLQFGLSLDTALRAVWLVGGIGFVAGFAIGNRGKRGP